MRDALKRKVSAESIGCACGRSTSSTGSLSRSLAIILYVGWFAARGHFWFERYAAGLVDIALSSKGLEMDELTWSAGTTQGYGYGTEMDA